jgi:dUTP pyrophosphatase
LEEIEVRLLDGRLREWGFPSFGSEGAAGLDLFACIDTPVRLAPGDEPVLISAGFALRIGSPRWCALVLPRSGRGHHDGLVLGNTVGLIDSDYTGPCMISAWNRKSAFAPGIGHTIEIRPGDRIAQLVVVPISRPTLRFVEEFSRSTARNVRGFGASGI